MTLLEKVKNVLLTRLPSSYVLLSWFSILQFSVPTEIAPNHVPFACFSVPLPFLCGRLEQKIADTKEKGHGLG